MKRGVTIKNSIMYNVLGIAVAYENNSDQWSMIMSYNSDS